MGVAGACCCEIVELIVDPGRTRKNREFQRKIEEEERLREIEKEKAKEERKKAFCEERERKDIKILENIEKLEPKYTDLYKPLPANKNAKLIFAKKPYIEGNSEKEIKIEIFKSFDNYPIKIDEDKYGIMYSEKELNMNFLDIYECLTQKFLYRITDINGDSIKFFVQLKDGTYYFKTFNESNNGIIKIIKDLGYQVIYNIYIEGGLL